MNVGFYNPIQSPPMFLLYLYAQPDSLFVAQRKQCTSEPLLRTSSRGASVEYKISITENNNARHPTENVSSVLPSSLRAEI